jgi:hypothetical protein
VQGTQAFLNGAVILLLVDKTFRLTIQYRGVKISISQNIIGGQATTL